MGTWEQDLASLGWAFDKARIAYNTFFSYLSDAWSQWDAGDDHAALKSVILADTYMGQVVSWAIGGEIAMEWPYPLIDFLHDYTGKPAVVDMHAIVDAMYNATPLEYQYFVSYVDAYRANMWNLPFYESWHAMLTRHFAE